MNGAQGVSCRNLIAGWMLLMLCGCAAAERPSPPRQPQTSTITAPNIEPVLLEDGP